MAVNLKSRIPQIQAELVARMEGVVNEIADTIVEEAKMRAPTDTGALKNSIHSEPAGPMGQHVIAGSDTVDYGLYVEFGTGNRPATPYFVPAVEKARDKSEGIGFRWTKGL